MSLVGSRSFAMMTVGIRSVTFDMLLRVAVVASVVGRVFGVTAVLGVRAARVVAMASGRGGSVVVSSASLVLVFHVVVVAVVSFVAFDMSL